MARVASEVEVEAEGIMGIGKRLAHLALLTAAFAAGAAHAADRVDPLFADHEVVELRIEGPIRAVVRDRAEKPEEHPAVMSWRTTSGDEGQLDIEIRARGKSRRDPEKCDFPPIRLDIPRSEADGTLFEHQDKLKLVTHCVRFGSSSANQHDWVWLEYVAYRIANSLTERSFQVRPLRVTYVDEEGREATHPGFLIEAEDRLAERLGLAENEAPTIARDAMEPTHTALMEVYQFLIANTDFSFVTAPGDEPCCHNAIQLIDEDGTHYPIPYDFDQAGLLDKPDAVPAPGLGIRSVTKRRFRGFCREPQYLESAVATITAQRATIDGLLAELPDLRNRTRRKAGRLIEKFWEVLESPRQLQRELVERCR